jgi:hypothetical protein
VNSFCYHDILPYYRPWNMEPSDHGLNPLKPWAKNKSFFPLLSCLSQYFVTVMESLTNIITLIQKKDRLFSY